MTLRAGEFNPSGAGWAPLPGLPPVGHGRDLYAFSDSLRAAGLAHHLAAGAESWEVRVPPAYLPGWETARTEFLARARTRRRLPLTGVRADKLVAAFASHVRNTE